MHKSTSAVIRCCGLLLLLWSWLAFDHYRPWLSFHSEALAFAGLGCLLCSLLMVVPGEVTLPRPAVVVFLAASLPLLQWLSGVTFFFGDALLGALFLIALSLAVVVGYVSANQPEVQDVTLPSYVHVIWIAALVSAGIGLAQWFGVQDLLQMYASQTDVGARAMGNVAQPNLLATLLLMGIGSLTLCYEKKLLGAFTFGLAVAFLSVVLILTESRAGLFSMAVVACFMVWKTLESNTRLAWPAVVVWVVACFLCRLVVTPLHQMLLLGDGRGMALTDNNGRWLIWQQAAAGIEQAPWLGYGWNQTPSAHAAGVLKFPGPGTFTNAHNVILDLLAWTGIPIGTVLAGTCIYWLLSRASRAARPETICAMAVVMPVFTHSLVEFPFAYGFFLVPVGLLIGFAEARLPAAPVRQVRKQWIWICAAVWSLAGMAVVYEYIQIEEDFRVIRFENMNIGRVPQGYEAPKLHVLTHMGAMLDASRLRPTPGMSNDQLEVLGKVSHRFSYGALALRNAIALGLNENPEAASRQMAVIKAMYGNAYYAAAVSEIRHLQTTKYPQLSAVQTP